MDKEVTPPYPVDSINGNPRRQAFFDIRIGDQAQKPRRVVFELAVRSSAESIVHRGHVCITPCTLLEASRLSQDDICPRTAENFARLCEAPAGRGYKNSSFHQVRPGFGLQGGDFLSGGGRQGWSAMEDRFFEDENFVGRHTVPGTLSMCNSGVDSNSSVFFVSVASQPHLDGRHVVFGQVKEGMDVIEEIASMFCIDLKPVIPVQIVNAGELPVETEAAAGVAHAMAAEAEGGEQARA